MPNKRMQEPCKRCGTIGRYAAGRGLCSSCWNTLGVEGRSAFPRQSVALREIVEELQHPARAVRITPTAGGAGTPLGRAFVRVALDLGATEAAAERAFYRAKRAGLLGLAA